MACPIWAILNNNSNSSASDAGKGGESTAPENHNPPQRNPIQYDTITTRSASHGLNVPVPLSNERGSLYNRRAGRLGFSKVPLLPTPPPSSPTTRHIETQPLSHELNTRRFSVFQALFDHPELVFEFAKHLDVEDLVSLYAISKDFHELADSRFTTLILSQSVGKASESSRTFAFRCYKPLCVSDPAARPNENHPDQVRDVPSLRWLRMVLYRERVVDEIILCLSAEGHFMPKGTSLVIKKIWFTIDISDNARRIGIIHNRDFWPNDALYLATLFFIKLDMRFNHPTTGNGERDLRKMLLGQRSLTTLSRVLKRQELRTPLEMLRMIVRWNYVPARHHAGMSILGVPASQVGRMRLEGWGRTTARFVQIDDLVMREAIRRDLDIHEYYLDMVLYGYVDKTTFQDVWHTEGPPSGSDSEDDLSDPFLEGLERRNMDSEEESTE